MQAELTSNILYRIFYSVSVSQYMYNSKTIIWFLHYDMLLPLFLDIIRDCVSTASVSQLFLCPLSLCQLRTCNNLATVKQNSVYCNCMPSQQSEVTFIDRTRAELTNRMYSTTQAWSCHPCRCDSQQFHYAFKHFDIYKVL
jgi:hypothetical protein